MPYAGTNAPTQTGSAYKNLIDANFAALNGIDGKRRNLNGDGRVNQYPALTALGGSWQYCIDEWEVATYDAVHSSGNFGQVADNNFPAQVAIGCLNTLTTSAAVTIGFRTKIESKGVQDLLNAPFLYPVSAPVHPFASLGLLAYQDSGQTVTVTPTIRSADAVDNFSVMTNSLTGAAQNLGSASLTQLFWDTAANAFQLDTLPNARNGICIEIDIAMPTGLTNKNIRIGDVQFEGGQVATYYGRSKYSDELRRCRRHLIGLSAASGVLGSGLWTGATSGQIMLPHPAEMRVPPTSISIHAAGDFEVMTSAGAFQAVTGLTFGDATPWATRLAFTTASGGVSGQGTLLEFNNAAASILLKGAQL